jgi:hypothetical protein
MLKSIFLFALLVGFAAGQEPPPFGTVIEQWNLPMSGSYAGSGITWNQSTGRFYLVDQGYQLNRVYELEPDDPLGTIEVSPWAPEPIQGASSQIDWGIAWDPDSNCFWVSAIVDGQLFGGCYLLRYVWNGDTWEQSLCLDGLPVGRFRYRPLQPETLWVTIPSALYERDCRVNLDIKRQAGDFAVVADLRVYQLYPYRQRMGGEGVEGTARLPDPSGLRLLDPKPALFRSSTRIPYSVSVPQGVALDVFDVQGRIVRRLASGSHKAGEYAARWNGTDESGRRLGCGTYFVQLRGTGMTETKKVVLAK